MKMYVNMSVNRHHFVQTLKVNPASFKWLKYELTSSGESWYYS